MEASRRWWFHSLKSSFLKPPPECEICFLHPRIPEHRVCFACFQHYGLPRWCGCARCGTHECLGLCQQLRWLKRVKSLFPYSAHHRGLLLAAKDLQCRASVLRFEAAYTPFAIAALRDMLAHVEFDAVVLARMRLPRIASSQWHPTEFWRRCLIAIDQQDECKKTARISRPVLMFPQVGLRRRALTSADDRRKKISEDELLAESQIIVQNGMTRERNVLLLDDVLTSGGALKREYESCRLKFGRETPVNFYALTLFRTPAGHGIDKDVDAHELAKSF